MLFDSKKHPIIIGGSHRSGTTLFRRIINSSNTIYCPPEIKFHKDLLTQYLNDELAFARLSSSIKVLDLPVEYWLDEFGKAFVNCYNKAAKQAGKNRWADKNPENCINIFHWHRLLNGKLKFILIVRNPLDIVASMNEANMYKTYPDDLQGKMDQVKTYLESALQYADANKNSSLIVKYEDLVFNTPKVMAQVFDWLNEPWDDQFLIKIFDTFHKKGLEDPKFSRHKNVSSENINRWKDDLIWDDVKMIEKYLHPLISHLGYPIQSIQKKI
ncbi:MAG TPA: sulfotransferase [Saprospiraceae bacterium]|nr:sulfotransferase [Saprospiraceae bacterium]